MALVSIIKNDSGALNAGAGSAGLMAWKFLEEDFNMGAQLIVAESEEAVFIKDGIAVQVFEGGRYTLQSNNYPFVKGLIRRFTGGVDAFSCKIYFVNKDHKLELLWGTDTPIQLRDPILLLQTSVMARGSFSVQVDDSKKFLLKLIGNNIQSFSQEELQVYFRSAFLQFIKDAIAAHIRESGREILEICADKTAIASALKPTLEGVLEEYGVRLVNFYVSGIDIPTDDPNRVRLEEAFASKGIMGILGEDWARQQSADILKDLANNPGAGGVAAAGAGLGMGLAAGGVFSDMSARLFEPMTAKPPEVASPVPFAGSRFVEADSDVVAPDVGGRACPGCEALVSASAKFCPDCGVTLRSQCGNCGAEMTASGKFCPECGSPKDAS